MEKRNQALDSIKGLAIILVMLGHCIVLNGMHEGIVYDGIKAIQMPLFMMVSGYTIGLAGKIDTFTNFLQKLKKRAIGYLIPFFVWIIILHVRHLPKEIINTLFQLDRGLWFLMTLFLLTAIMYLAILIRECTILRNIGFILVWLLAFLGLLLQIHYKVTFLSPHLTIYYMPFYFGGYVICRIYETFTKKTPENIIANVILNLRNQYLFGIIVLILFIILILKYDMVVANNKWELLCQLGASVCGCYLCYLLIRMLPACNLKRGLSFVGNYTLEIYVLHYHFATILGIQHMELELYSLEGVGYILLTFMIMSALTAAGIWLCKKVKIIDLLLFGKMKVMI